MLSGLPGTKHTEARRFLSWISQAQLCRCFSHSCLRKDHIRITSKPAWHCQIYMDRQLQITQQKKHTDQIQVSSADNDIRQILHLSLQFAFQPPRDPDEPDLVYLQWTGIGDVRDGYRGRSCRACTVFILRFKNTLNREGLFFSFP